ncbi:hypothetical protein HN51_012840 [Arachis hypogaea]
MPILCLLLELYLTSVTAFAITSSDYRAFASMLGHYSVAYPEILPSLLSNREAVVVDKMITKYQTDEYILFCSKGFLG